MGLIIFSCLEEDGRLHVPESVCKRLSLCPGDPVIFNRKGSRVFMENGAPHCILCGAVGRYPDESSLFVKMHGAFVCPSCIRELKNR